MENNIVGLGEILWDIFPTGKEIGGAPANFAYHIAQFGFPAYVVSAVGKDDLGKEAVDTLKEKGLNMIIEHIDYPTGTVIIELDNNGVPTYNIAKNTAWDNIPFTDSIKVLAENTRAVSFGSLAQRSAVSRDTIYRFLESMPKGDGIYKIFDINLRQNFYTKDIIETSLIYSNVLKINEEEIVTVADMFNYEEMSPEEKCFTLITKYNLKIVILTCGEHGSYVITRDDISFIDTPKVDVVDTVGAGDSFTAAFLAALLRGATIREAHRRAVKVSAYVCANKGAMPDYDSREFE